MMDLALPLGLPALISRNIVVGKNWRNLVLLDLLQLFATGNGLLDWEAARGAAAAQGMGLRMGLGAGIAMIAVVGARIILIFIRNLLVIHKDGPHGQTLYHCLQFYKSTAIFERSHCKVYTQGACG